MRKAMHDAELGDDVFGDDPTVNRLQARAAEIFGFEAALLFPTGTQSNLAALMTHCQRGEEVILGSEAHSYRYEAGGLAVLASIQPQTVANRPDGSRTIRISRGPACWRWRTPSAAGLFRGNTCRKRSRWQHAKAWRRISTARASSTHRSMRRPASRRSAQDSIRCLHACRRGWERRRARYWWVAQA
jgi:hypothetical protein